MTREELLTTVAGILRDIFDDDELEVTESTCSDDVEDWDSLSHIQLIVAIEKAFHIKFTSKEILSWRISSMTSSVNSTPFWSNSSARIGREPPGPVKVPD